MRSMKVTYFINHYPKVSHTFIRNEILGLEGLGIEVERVSIHSDKDIYPDNPDFSEKAKTHYLLAANKIKLGLSLIFSASKQFKRVIECSLLCLKLSRTSDRGLLKNLFYLGEGVLLAEQVKRNGSQHIHAHFGTNSTDIAMYASMIAQVPFSFTVHGPEEFDRTFGINLGEKIKRADSVFAITKYCQSQLFRWCAYEDWKKIRIVHCGLGEIFFDPSTAGSAPEAKNDGMINALFIGRLCEQKGPMILLESLPALLNDGIKLHVTFAGDGELRHEMEKFISENSLEHAVTITGWVDSNRIKALLQKSTLMILPSFAEGLPVAIMEALALKVPVLTTHINGIPELIEHGRSGLLVTPGCKESLIEAIKAFDSLTEQERFEIVEEGYKRVEVEHSSATESKKIQQYLMPEIS